jgi:hypothetical protein
MTQEKRTDRIRALLMKLEDCEQQGHALGLHEAAHAINAAKNAVGWGFAAIMERSTSVTPPEGKS